MKIIEFISTFENYNLEKTIKNYTIRDLTERLKNKLKGATHIRIRKGYTNESFTKEILLVFYWKDFVIISWKQKTGDEE